MAAGNTNRIELKKVVLRPAAQMATAAKALDRLDGEMRALVERYDGRMRQRREQIHANLREVPIPADAKVAAARTQMSRSDHETRQEARPALDALLQQVGGLHREVVSQRANYRDKRQVLLRQGLGTEERARYEQTCARATPIALANLAQQALARSDLVLASAVAAEQAARPRSERLFSIQDFLRDIDIPEFAAADEAYRTAEARVTSIAARQREFLTGRPSGTQQIELALAKREENPELLDAADMQPGGREEE
jgi:hypothetical protein